MAELDAPFITCTPVPGKKGQYRYEGGADAKDAPYCRWYWIEVVVGRTTRRGRMVHQDHKKGGGLPLPNPQGWQEGRTYDDGTVTLKSSPEQGGYDGNDVVTEDTATITF